MGYRMIQVVLLLLSLFLAVASVLPLSTMFLIPDSEAAPYIAVKLFFLPAIGLLLLGAAAAGQRRGNPHRH